MTWLHKSAARLVSREIASGISPHVLCAHRTEPAKCPDRCAPSSLPPAHLPEVVLRLLHAHAGQLPERHQLGRLLAGPPLPAALERPVGAHCAGAVADEAGEVVRGEALRRVRHDGGAQAQAVGDEVVVDRSHGKQRGDGGAGGVLEQGQGEGTG